MSRTGWWLLAFIMLARLAVALIFPIMPEEAYHWNFGCHLDWSYYDHPPMIAWSIALGRFLLGDCLLGVRLVPLLFSLGTALLLANLARRFYGREAAAWAILLQMVEPAVVIIGGWGFPDSPVFFFWALTLNFAWLALVSRHRSWWLATGAAIGAAMLAKYTAAFLVLSLLVYLCASRRNRRWFLTPWPYLTTLVALLVFSPVLYWNATHDWVSFRFQSANRFNSIEDISAKLGWRHTIDQWGMILPLTLPLGIAAGIWLWRSRRPKERFLFWTFIPMFLFFAGMGWTSSFHLLWPVPTYLGLTVAMAGLLSRRGDVVSRLYAWRPDWMVVTACIALIFGSLYAVRLLPGLPPVRGLLGWDEVADYARQEYQKLPPGSFYVGYSLPPYRTASQLAYHLHAPELVHGNNLLGDEGLQYQYWASMDKLAGKDAVVVMSIQAAPANWDTFMQIKPWFESLEYAGEVLVHDRKNRELVRCAIYRGHGYRPVPDFTDDNSPRMPPTGEHWWFLG
jgi:dolichol-phosphate mannosyltransferase